MLRTIGRTIAPVLFLIGLLDSGTLPTFTLAAELQPASNQFDEENTLSDLQRTLSNASVRNPALRSVTYLRLGDLLRIRRQGDREDNLEKAVGAYYAALSPELRRVDKTLWAEVESKLGDGQR